MYGHTPVPAPEWINRTLCIDTGCVFGGALTALRYPEKELVQVKAQQVYFEPKKPLHVAPRRNDGRPEGGLDVSDVMGKRSLRTRVHHAVKGCASA